MPHTRYLPSVWWLAGLPLLTGGLLAASPVGAQRYFEDVLPQALGQSLAFRGGAAGDYDNDGRIDFFVQLTDDSRIGLLHGEGLGRLRIVRPGLPDKPVRVGGLFGDYDGDGDLDLFAPSGTVEMPRYDVLLRNDRGSFVDVALAAGLIDSLPSTAALWLDYDVDGHLDLYVGHAVSPKDTVTRPELRNRLHRNLGDGTFADVTAAAGLDVQLHPKLGGSYWGMAANDFDSDGWPDLYVSVRRARNRLFLSDGQGGFVDETTAELGGAPEENSLGVAVGDIDNDGDLDLFQAVASDQTVLDVRAPISDISPDLTNPQRSRLLLNLGGAEFLDITEGAGVNFDDDLLEAAFADIDNDGDLDLLTSPGNLLVNEGEGTFADSTARSADVVTYVSFADYDRDGFPDYLDASAVLSNGLLKRNSRLEPDNHWLVVELVGTRSNRNGVGARVIASTGMGSQTRELRAGWGHNQDEMVAHFGFGSQPRVEQLEICWPSGQLDVLTDIPCDQRIRVVEAQGTYYPVESVVWITPPPAALVVGSTSQINAVVRPALFERQARVSRVTADLSALGGPDAVPLGEVGDGAYRLALELTPSDPGAKQLSVLIEQTTSVGPRWSRLVGDVVVFPGGDMPVWHGAPESWEAERSGRVEELDLTQGSLVYRGDVAAAIQVRKTFSPWKVVFRPGKPVPRQGYEMLRFAFHPGDISLETGASLSVALVPGKATGLLDLVDAQLREWQVVEIPLYPTAKDEPIEAISFAGTFGGRFFLDAIELIATVLPDSDLPVFVEALHDGWAVRSEWMLNLSRDLAYDTSPDWSPGGQRVAFCSARDSDWEIHVVDATGANLVNLTRNPGVDAVPVWSPDGTRIAFYSYRDGYDAVWVMNADGSDPVELAACGDYSERDRPISWSPDGRRIAFRSERDGNYEIYVMEADGANPANLTVHPGRDNNPSWSPDGTRIAFDSDRGGDHQIYVMNADGSDPVNVTTHPGFPTGPDWSPDGRKIAFVARREGNQEIYAIESDGSDPVNLTNHPADDSFPSWSPDGSRMVFESDREGNREIYVLEAGNTENVTVEPASVAGLQDRICLQVQTEESGQWRVVCQPQSPLDVTGYHALHFAFHPGGAVAPQRASLRVGTSQGEIDLLAAALEDRRIDLEVRDWQAVELPLKLFHSEGPIGTIAFSGDITGTFYLDDIRLVKATPTITAVVEEQASRLPTAFSLSQNYPNPFNPVTTIRFTLPTPAQVDLSLYNLLGQHVATLVSGLREAGVHALRWDGRDDGGVELASGVYLYRLQAGARVETRKLLLLR